MMRTAFLLTALATLAASAAITECTSDITAAGQEMKTSVAITESTSILQTNKFDRLPQAQQKSARFLPPDFYLRVGGRRHKEWIQHSSLPGYYHKHHVWPEAFMASRCDATGACETCGLTPGDGDLDCWQGHGYNKRDSALFVGNYNTKWKRHLARITLRCPRQQATEFQIVATPQSFFNQASGSRFSVYVNGHLVRMVCAPGMRWLSGESDIEEGRKPDDDWEFDGNCVIKGSLSASPNGELHEILLEYNVSADWTLRRDAAKFNYWHEEMIANPQVFVLEAVKFHMDPDFALCEESKLCLDRMMPDHETPTQGSMLLRGSQQYQLHCLENLLTNVSSALQEACASWQSCLNSSGTLANMTAILGASVHTVSSSLVESVHTVSSSLVENNKNSVSLPQCKTPTDLDPEGWDCECHDSMKRKCDQLLQVHVNYTDCFQALLCNDNGVCHSWKTRNCKTEAPSQTVNSKAHRTLERVKILQDELALLQPQLLQKRAFHDSSSAEDGMHQDSMFEETLMDKLCV